MFSEGGIAQIVVNIAMFALMFGMGLTLQAKDFRLIAKAPGPVIIGTALQLLVMPILGLGIASIFALPPLLTVGLVVLAALPGGMFSNIYVHIAKGNTALSVTLTALATLVTLFTLPLWMEFAFAQRRGGAGEAVLDVPILETALQLGFLTILPVALGMLVRAFRPSAVFWEKRLSLPCFVLIVLGVAFQGSERPEAPIAELQMSLLPVLCYTVGGIVLGIVIPMLMRISARDTVTLTVELVVKNTLLGLVLLTKTLDFAAVVPLLVFMVLQTPAGIGLLFAWRMLAKAGWVAAIPEQEAA